MINKDKLKTIIAAYKKHFPAYWEDEKFKWEAVKHFQDNWDINAPDFAAMFTRATDKTFNLLASQNNFPRGMIRNFAAADAESTRAMFISLFDETKDFSLRAEKFQSDAEAMRVKYNDGTWKLHYQTSNAISTYLWLRFPDKYYIYKYSECLAVAKELDSDFIPKKGANAANLAGGFKLYNEICEELGRDEELTQMFRSALTETCYPDPALKTLAIDVAYFIYYYLKIKPDKPKVEADPPEVPLHKDKTPGDEAHGYWWLNANPKIWSFAELAVGDVQSYTLYNDNGNKRRIFQNFLDAKSGDLVIGYESNPVKQVVALAKVTRENDGENIYFEKVEGLATPIDYTTLKNYSELERMEYFTNPQGSLFKLTKGEYDFIVDLIREENPVASKESAPPFTKDDFLKDVFMTGERFDTLVSLLKNKKNLILQGAPGVGKTFAAKRLAYAFMKEKNDSRIEFVQFHQNYTYEDFIMGYKPSGEGFELQTGIFHRFCQRAANAPDKPFFFIIDEINRGNISKIFGELLMLIEKDYRGAKATLAYSGIPFAVPENLYIIGLMNTADRSLAMIDYALRRRFSFFEMEPGYNSDGFRAYQTKLDNDTFNTLIERIKELNKEIAAPGSSLGKGFCIGHSYFCNRVECSDEWMMEVVEYDILPMLGEYWFDEPDKLRHWENALRGVFND